MRLFLFLFLISSVGFATEIVLKQPVLQTVTPTSTQVLAVNPLRKFAYIRNDGPQTAWIRFGSNSVAYTGFPVISGATLQFNSPYTPGGYAYGEAEGSAALTIIEGQ